MNNFLKISAIDFDETLIKVNSFPLWVRFCLKQCFFDFKFITFLRVFLLCILRKIKIISHIKFKSKLNSEKSLNRYSKMFLNSVECYINLELIKILSSMENCNLIVVTTAAPSCYADYIPMVFSKYFEFNANISILASSSDDKGMFIDNYGENKKTNYLSSFQDADLIFFASDDLSDLPMMELAENSFIVKGDKILRVIT